MSLLFRLLISTVLLLTHSNANASSEVEIDDHGTPITGDASPSYVGVTDGRHGGDTLECGLWLAPSTIQGAGLGMYAGVDFDTNDDLLRGGDSVIAISDIASHNANKKFSGDFLWDEYTWNAESLKMKQEGFHEVNVASEGFGAAANSFLPLFNVEEWYPLLTGTGLDRSKDAGAGASTLFHHRKSTAKFDIPAGTELFVSYGENWFTTRSALGPIPLTDDLDSATSVLKKFTTLQETLVHKSVEQATEIAADIWKTFVTDTKFDDSRVLLGGFKHHDPDELHRMQTEHDSNVTATRMSESTRTLDWLREHGTCGDHMIGEPSTLTQAGMGAFATRTLPVDTVVAHLPMIHIPNRSRFEMYQLRKTDEDEWVPIDGNVTGHQLLLNYCYGHGESSILLCPYGPMVNYVNHNQTQANVRLQWGHASRGNHMPNLLDESIEAIESSDATAKLAMEFVATREIKEGEEIFLDYGSEWEAAWQLHLANWQPVPGASTHKASVHWEADTSSRLRSVYEELTEKTYPDGVQMMCDTAIQMEGDAVEKHYRAGTLEGWLWENDSAWWPCSILRSQLDEEGDGEYAYTIHLYQIENGTPSNGFLIENVPRGIFHFVDKPGTSDVFLPNAFRHDVRIPDEIFPLSWRNAQK